MSADRGRAAPGAVAGTRSLIRLALRRDRLRLPLWLGGLTAVSAVSANAVAALYDTPVKQAGYGATVADSAVSRMMGGIPRDVDQLGGILAYEVAPVASVVVALMVIFFVVRHTRAEEESGRAELLRSTVAGRHAALLAALTISISASLLAGVSVGMTLLLAGAPGTGSLLFAAGLGALGLVFTAVTAVAVQLASSARRSLGIALAVLLVAFVLRGYGAVGETWWTWTSPFGWQDELRPFAQDPRWWPLLVSLVASALCLAAAAWLAAHRDFAAGLLPERTGAPRARAWLSTPWGLAFHQQRGLLASWGTGLVVLAALFGAMSREVVTMVESNPDLAVIISAGTDDLVQGYLAYMVNFLGVTVGAFAVVSALRLAHSEEASLAENVLAAGVSRARWAWSGIAVTLGNVAVVLVAVGLVMGLSHALVTDERGLLGPLLGAAVATGPAVLLLGSAVFALHGWAPRWVLLGWIPLAWAFVQSYLGDLLDLPGWAAGLSPFEHLAQVPLESFAPGPALVQATLAVTLTLVGVAGLRRRDLG